jgi:hypothetical protein
MSALERQPDDIKVVIRFSEIRGFGDLRIVEIRTAIETES